MTAIAIGDATARRLWRRGRGSQKRWTAATLLVAALVAVPVLGVVALALGPSAEIWRHLATTVLPTYALNTLWLMLGVGIGTFVIGVGTAWLVTACAFPGRAVFAWALMVPLAMPAYVIAYVYTDLFDYAGPVQMLLREAFGWRLAGEYWFPEVRSLGGAIVLMSLVLYPYVYLLARAAFQEQSVCVLEVSRTLGCGAWRSFAKVALPLARPAIAAGVALVLLETLNDFGTVDYFAVNTFTRGIFNVWFGMNSVAGAAQIAVALLVVVLVVLALERAARRKRRYHHTSGRQRPLPRYELRGARAGLAFAACLAPISLGFLLPGVILAGHAVENYRAALDEAFVTLAANSLFLSAGAAAIAVGLSLVLAYGARLDGRPAVRVAVRIASLGYAVPGAVLAVGVLSPFGWLDNAVDGWMRANLGVSTGLLLSGTVVAILFGYTVRFLAISFGTIEAGLAKIRPSMDDAARSLGLTPAQTLWRVHVPLMRGSALAAAILVFVDAMKELPMTLVLRPFNVQTLATHVYQYAGDEQLERSALAALAIVAVGLLPVIILSGAISPARRERADRA